MTVPSKEEFKTVLELLDNFNAKELVPEVESVKLEYDSIYNFYVKLSSRINDKRFILADTKIVKWLNNDYGYRLGVESVFGKGVISKSRQFWDKKGIENAERTTKRLLKKYRFIEDDKELASAPFVKSEGPMEQYLSTHYMERCDSE